MSAVTRDVQQRYSEAFSSYLARADEVALHQAYEFGRKALADGIGVLDIAVTHHHAVDAVIAGETAEQRRVGIARAAEFLAETLSPFEMSLRGYRETNARLIGLNQALRQARAAAEAANRELESFSYSVAHDLRAPLRGVDGFSLALIQDYAHKLDAEGCGYLEHVRESAQQMGRLIDDLLALSRVTRSELVREPVDLSGLARNVAAQLQSAQPDRRVDVDIAAGMVVDGDARLLRVVLENLIGNAWKFTGRQAEPRIEVGSTESNDGSFFVRDNGAGFDMAYASKLFGAFQRLHSTDEFEGTGIGLATVQRIINRHGGRIWAIGEVGRGATFYLELGGEALRS
jgi:light-regulated signal transduction histidine kinase (bacteriophytochrome)